MAACGDDGTSATDPVPNRAPLPTAEAIPVQTVTVGRTATVDVSGTFTDSDGDALTYVAVSSDDGIASASMDGNVVTVSAVAEGETTVAVTARDPYGLEVRAMFSVAVRKVADRAALVALYNATGGTSWTHNDNWLTDEPIGNWHGVEVNSAGRVATLFLGENGLTGEIPPELGQLENLQALYLVHSGLTGEIPTELGPAREPGMVEARPQRPHERDPHGTGPARELGIVVPRLQRTHGRDSRRVYAVVLADPVWVPEY